MVTRAGHSFPYFARTKHFRLGEKSGRSPVIYGRLGGQVTNGRSSVISEVQNSYGVTNGRSFISSNLKEFEQTVSYGPTLYRPEDGLELDLSNQLTHSTGPTYTSFYLDGQNDSSVGHLALGSGEYTQINLINRFGFRGEQYSIRGFNDAQTQPRPTSVTYFNIPNEINNSSLAVWLDASDRWTEDMGLSPFDNSVVRWNNKAPSGTSWLQEGDASNRPVWVSGDGYPAGVTFDGVSQYLTNTNLSLSSTSGEIFMVVVMSGKPVYSNLETVWGASQASASNKFLALRPYENRTYAGPAISANNTAGIKEVIYEEATTDTLASGVTYVINFRSSGLGMPWGVSVNSSGLTGTTVEFAAHEGVWHGAMGGLDTINIGSVIINSTNGQYWAGRLCSLIGYEEPLTDAKRSEIFTYLSDEWQ